MNKLFSTFVFVHVISYSLFFLFLVSLSFSMSAGFFVVLPWEPGKVIGVFVIRPLKSVLDLVKDRDPEFE